MAHRVLVTSIVLCFSVWQIQSATGLDVRLANGQTPNSGRLEVRLSKSSAWGTVCDDGWVNMAATVACRQLGYVWGEAVGCGQYGAGAGEIYLDEVRCAGTEASLLQCKHSGWGINNCKHSEDAGVVCQNTEPVYEEALVITSLPEYTFRGLPQVALLPGTPSDPASWTGISSQKFEINANLKILSCAVDYKRHLLYVYDFNFGAISCVESFNWNHSFSDMKVSMFHNGVSRAFTKLAVDWISHNVYWTEPLSRWIAMRPGVREGVQAESGQYKVVVRDIEAPTAIAVDPIHGFMFWSDLGSVVKIKRATLTGESPEVLISTGLAEPLGIVVDIVNKKIYWVDARRDTVESSDFDGGDRQIITRLSHSSFFDIALHGVFKRTNAYQVNGVDLGGEGVCGIVCQTVWDDARKIPAKYENIPRRSVLSVTATKGEVMFMNKHSGELVAMHTDDLQTFYGISVYSAEVQPQEKDFCETSSCDDMCVSSDTGAVCMCREGYQLATDGTTCKEAAGAYHRALVMSDGEKICVGDIRMMKSSLLDGYNISCFYDTSQIAVDREIRYLDIDMDGRHVIFATPSTIYRVNIDGQTPVVQRIITTVDEITGLALDWLNGYVYWSTKTNISMVSTQTLDDIRIKRILASDNPRDIIVLPHDRIYWVESSYMIRSADMTGSDLQTLSAYVVNDPDLLLIYQGLVLWTQNNTSESYIGTQSLYDKQHKQHSVPLTDLGVLRSIKVLDDVLQPMETGPCRAMNGGCEQICIPLGRIGLCQCQYGYLLQGDNRSCSSTPLTDNFLLLSDWTHNTMYQISLTTSDVRAVDTDDVGQVSGVIFNPDTQTVIWGDKQEHVIKSVNLNGSGYSIISNISVYRANADRFAIDFSTGNIFYTAVRLVDTGFLGVAVLSTEGHHRKLVTLSDGSIPRDIVVHPTDGKMFWTNYGSSPKVTKANMDGSMVQPVIITKIHWPTGLAIDYQADVLYVSDGAFDTIQRCTYTGECSLLVTDQGAHIMDIDVSGQYLYYVAWNRPFVTKVNKADTSDVTYLASNAELVPLEAVTVYESNHRHQPVHHQCSLHGGRGDCSTLCLPTPNGHTCACQDGVSMLPGDKICEDEGGVRVENITQSPLNVYNGNDTELVLTCKIVVIGYRETEVFTYWWTYNNTVIQPRRNSRFSLNSSTLSFPKKKTSSLRLKPVRLSDSGSYACFVAHKASGVEAGRNITVTVISQPVVTLTPASLTINESTNVTLMCEVIRPLDGQFDFHWYMNGQLLQSREDAEIVRNTTSAQLMITVITATTEFGCEAENNASIIGPRAVSYIGVIPTKVDQEKPTVCEEALDYRGIVWPIAAVSTITVQGCPPQTAGTVTRKCNANGEWSSAKYDCVQQTIQAIQQQISQALDGLGSANVMSSLRELANATDIEELLEGDMSAVVDALTSIADVADEINTTAGESETETQNFLEVASNLLNKQHKGAWKADINHGQPGAINVAQVAETFINAKQLSSSTTGTFTKHYTLTNIYAEIGRSDVSDRSAYTFPNNEVELPSWMVDTTTALFIPAESFNEMPSKEYSSQVFRNLPDIVAKKLKINGQVVDSGSMDINSDVTIAFQSQQLVTNLDPPAHVTFQHSSPNYSRPICVFWDFRETIWSSDGCAMVSTSDTHTVCSCNHFTNFAVLMSPGKTPDSDLLALSIISAIGCGISLSCLVLTVGTHLRVWRLVKSSRATLLMHLCVSLILAYVVFLTGINRAENEDVCTAIAVLLHYLWLVVFFLMLAEGIEIAVSVIYVFVTKSRLKWLVPLAWGVPAIIVGISMGVSRLEGYGTDTFCWLSTEDGLLWAFVGPAAFVILVNFIIIIAVFRKMFKSSAILTKTDKEKAKTGVRSLCVLLPVLGLSWVFGIFSVNEDLVAFQYIFAICNGLQGFFIFLFHCLLNRQLKEAWNQTRIRKKSLASFEDNYKKQKSSVLASTKVEPTHPASKTTFGKVKDAAQSKKNFHKDRSRVYQYQYPNYVNYQGPQSRHWSLENMISQYGYSPYAGMHSGPGHSASRPARQLPQWDQYGQYGRTRPQQRRGDYW